MRTAIKAIAALLGLLTAAVGVWAFGWPDSFSDFVNFPPHRHFVHDVGAFQLGIGATLLLATIWADGLMVALAGYLVGGVVHTASHLIDRDLGGSPAQTILIALFALLAAVALWARWRQLGWLVGDVGTATTPVLAPFVHQKTIALTTYRRDGTPISTPVSIAVDGDRAYVRSFERAWKTRRMANNPEVTVAPSNVRGTATGPAVRATARRLSGAEYVHASQALGRKYPFLHRVFVPMTHRLGRAKTGRTVHFELVPEARPSHDHEGSRLLYAPDPS
jgi:PPOX class probable F420-dependent enzyme